MNCSINENSVFSKAEFKELFDSYGRVRLYTDTIPNKWYAPTLQALLGGSSRQTEDAKANQAFQGQAFDTKQLPLYVILEPLANGKIKVVGTYSEGKINDEAAFAKFLKDPLENGGGRLASAK